MYLWHGDDDQEIYNHLLKSKNRIIARYPNILELDRKDLLQKIMDIAYEHNSEEFDFVPKTFTFPKDEKRFN